MGTEEAILHELQRITGFEVSNMTYEVILQKLHKFLPANTPLEALDTYAPTETDSRQNGVPGDLYSVSSGSVR